MVAPSESLGGENRDLLFVGISCLTESEVLGTITLSLPCFTGDVVLADEPQSNGLMFLRSDFTDISFWSKILEDILLVLCSAAFPGTLLPNNLCCKGVIVVPWPEAFALAELDCADENSLLASSVSSSNISPGSKLSVRSIGFLSNIFPWLGIGGGESISKMDFLCVGC